MNTEELKKIEKEGIVPDRAPQEGDCVFTPRYVQIFGVHKARKQYPCDNSRCQTVIEKGQLHASSPVSRDHYCLNCATFENGTPTGRAREWVK